MALVAACSALCAATMLEQRCLDAQSEARMKALKNLQEQALALKVSENKTVKDFIESTDLPKTDLVGGLLQGAVEFQPPCIYGDGDCEVRLALSGDALRANLKRILEKNYKKEGGEFAKLTFDGIADKGLEASATSPVAVRPASAETVADGVPGWSKDASGQPASAHKRIQAEHAAYLEGLAALKADAEKLKIGDELTLGALMASNPIAKDAAEKFLAKSPADRKLYWPKGIVEVRFALDSGALWTALEQANQKPADPTQRIPTALLVSARERTKNQILTASGFAQVEGKPVSGADVVQTAAQLDLNAMTGSPIPEPEQAK
jgi:hypothetical protein